MSLYTALKPLNVITRYFGHAPYKFEASTSTYKFDPITLIYSTVTIISSVLATARLPDKTDESFFLFYDFVLHSDCFCTLINIVTLLIKLKIFVKTLTEMELVETKLKRLMGKLPRRNIFKMSCIGIFILVNDVMLRSIAEYFVFLQSGSKPFYLWNSLLTDIALLQFYVLIYVPLDRLRRMNIFIENVFYKNQGILYTFYLYK